jgi:maltose alpha-D-glucosyltransferase / alpha-amylase
VKKLSSATDPLWYKDAVIYELHVRAFADSNGDGIGDFPGLLSRLDYLQDLGVTCIWLLPFFPSPLRDDGYDISNYVDVNPSYGTLNDFRSFLNAAHQRDMQVMIELVVNHTSDQHPWFKAARAAPPGSPQREMYVWSNSDQLYKNARIIFTDTEKSNWTWDETAKAYYWHRFFSHQPDLNYDNPLVIEEVLKAMRFWLDMGVDGLRMDAIPYLCERDGTSCENLPETHSVIKRIRSAIDAGYANRLILAEANQWPADVRPYFGDGDECHMAFHFPLMPRIYMALRQEDRLPITDIMAQTPAIPDNCQWALFLRNHDELTLEMVTDDERDYMYLAYSADPRMRVNVGIRRRLAPLVDNNRRRIELLNSLLFSFPGTPIIYYGDELGMGDNIYLGDRNGVRTPMQWSSDRNAGFSRCDPARLYLPVVMDPIYGYQVINVEAQLSDQSSLLHWTRNMIALRKLFQVFGRGTLKFLNPGNRKILAYLRDLDRGDGTHETVLCVANLSRFAQPASLDLSDFAGSEPVEMLGYVPFPPIAAEPYAITLAPYSFLWLELQPPAQIEPAFAGIPATAAETTPAEELATVSLGDSGWAGLIAGGGQLLVESALMSWLPRQRWFGAKTRRIQAIGIADWVQIPTGPASAGAAADAANAHAIAPALFIVEVQYASGAADTYQVPLALAVGVAGDELSASAPQSVIASFASSAGPVTLHDATVDEDFRQSLLALIEGNTVLDLPSSVSVADGADAADLPLDAAEPSLDAESGEARQARPGVPAVAPAPITAQPGEAAAPPRTEEPGPGTAGSPQPATDESGAPGTRAHPVKQLDARRSTVFAAVRGSEQIGSRVGSAEQSNTSILYGKNLILKIFRRLQNGENPDVEIGWFLTEVAHFRRIPTFLGEISIVSENGDRTTLAMLQELVANQGDGWQWFLDRLAGFYSCVAARPAPPSAPAPGFEKGVEPPSEIRQHATSALDAAAVLGRRTAEMHLALATPTDDSAFVPEPVTVEDLERDARRIDAEITSTLEMLKSKLSALKDVIADQAALLLSKRIDLFTRANAITSLTAAGQRIRIHGDYHLGQTLRTEGAGGDPGDFVLLDFEGEPARPLAERRQKQSPLKDVAGMLRSFSYAAHAGLDRYLEAHPDGAESGALNAWAGCWQSAVSAEFLHAYREAIAVNRQLLPPDEQAQPLLSAYLLEKALYELLYELNNRPAWLPIPLSGILNL